MQEMSILTAECGIGVLHRLDNQTLHKRREKANMLFSFSCSFMFFFEDALLNPMNGNLVDNTSSLHENHAI